jgi:hypothetical protein
LDLLFLDLGLLNMFIVKSGQFSQHRYGSPAKCQIVAVETVCPVFDQAIDYGSISIAQDLLLARQIVP